MRTMYELRHSQAVANFKSHPRWALGVVIFIAGSTLLTVQALSLVYR